MSLQHLLELFRDDERTNSILQNLSTQKQILLQHCIGSAPAFVLTALFQKTDYTHLFIADDSEQAMYILNDLQNILPKTQILYLPSSYRKQNSFEELSNNNILTRAQTLNALLRQKKDGNIIVTYPEALLEKIVHAQKLQENTLALKVGEKVDVDFILDVLIEYGFERTDFVYEPGEFSIRGGIIDIFSFGNEQPYRIELFDDEVESMRTFEVETQISIQKISELTIVPNVQTHFTDEQHADIFEYLPEKTLIWFNDTSIFVELIEKYFERALGEFYAIQENSKIKEHHFKQKTLQQLFVLPETLFGHIEQKNILAFKTNQNYFLKSDTQKWFTIDYLQVPQPSFNRNFDLLIKDLQLNQKEQFSNYIFSENAKQIERFEHIFKDKNADIKFIPVYIPLAQGFVDRNLGIACYTDHQIFERYFKYKTKQGYTRNKAISIKQLKDLNPGDYVVHIDHGIGKFSGLQIMNTNGVEQEMVRIIYKDNDILYVNINSLYKISKYTGKEGTIPKVHKLGTNIWNTLKQKTKAKVKDIAQELIALYAKRKVEVGFAFQADTYLQDELEASFMYEDTPDQIKATLDIKQDMEKPHPMDRLICGDVGFGKTEVAIRAAFKAVNDSKQVAVLVPTTILAWQHFKTFSKRLEDLPVKVDFINRFKTAKEKTATLKELEEGKIDILIGTHALLNKKIKFKDLGLLVIDEEQKFGVAAKEKLRQMATNVDTLTLTATPIPRTLKFSMMGARDLSNIMTPPPNRIPVTTEVHTFNVEFLKEAIEYEVYRGGQVFFVHNRVKDLHEIDILLKRLMPDIKINAAHGQMEGDKLEEIMLEFINGEFDVLLSTNIVESGLDIPNANTIIINDAQNFGLSDLHQLRGRVGRGNKKAFCYLLAPPKSSLTSEAKKRLQTLEEFSDLGSGFQIALRDMDIRGAGNLLGGEQSGFITDIGFEMYHKILDEAITELKHTEFKEVFKEQIEAQTEFVRDCSIDTDLEMLIPNNYIQNTEERLRIYTQLDEISNEAELTTFTQNLNDRFGKIPKEVNELFDGLRIRWLAKKIGFERIILKGNKLRCYFLDNPNSPYYESGNFGKVMQYIQEGKKRCILKQNGNNLILTYENIHTMNSAEKILQDIVSAVLI
ncbi:MAG TPA: transcription-repair coupling factor [Chitinophagales bacterium]|nr:transcription-repair coupling factor [Chitinophagales bacterium]MCB9074275.1 transcription-repair coupling factor [Chitinophagales bacterium]HMU99009.1 transcription-repair coupling factor [Chitinophagales bacterium]HMY43280.1 transcription-repair coupling factor [Chitinophagales bacterium]HNB38111.1 transcription-repair coupling factor [Chitinophagales bacterium]